MSITDIQLAVEVVAAFLLGGFAMALWPAAKEMWDHRGHKHEFAHVWAHIHNGAQRDLKLCECGVSRFRAHQDRCDH